MQVIYAIDPKTQNAARVVINCEAYRELFIDFLLAHGLDAAITDEEVKPTRSPEEEAMVNWLMEVFHNELNSRVLN